MYYYYRLYSAKQDKKSKNFGTAIGYVVGYALAAVACLAGYSSVTRSCADIEYKQNTLDSLRAAVQLAPSNASYHIALSFQLDLAGKDPAPELYAAARLEPLLAEPWLRLGLLAEQRGQTKLAENFLLRATSAGQLLLPRSTLMAFYFRRGNAPAFWRWARLSLERGYGDCADVFDLCWRMAGDPSEVYAEAVPKSRQMLRAYVEYLLSRDRVTAAVAPARDLIPKANADDLGILAEACDRILPLSVRDAIGMWNLASEVHLFPYPPLAPASHAAIVDGDFRHEPIGAAFDWKVVHHNEISTSRLPGAGMEWTFTGRQPEVIDLLSQTVAARPAGTYQVQLDYKTDSIGDPTGLTISCEDPSDHRLLHQPTMLSAADRHSATPPFTVPTSGLVLFRLRYMRPIGEPRTDGRLIIRNVRLEVAP